MPEQRPPPAPARAPPGRLGAARPSAVRALMQYGGRVDDRGQVFVPPGEVAAALGVSGSTFRRISQDYEGVFSPLPRDGNNRRLWTVEAARRVQLAHEAVREGRADSTRAALELLRDGRHLPARADLDHPPAPDVGRALAQVEAQVQAQGDHLARLVQALDARDAELAGALHAVADAQRAQAQALADLRAQVQELAARPAPAPPSAPPRGVLSRVLLAILGGRA